MDNVFDMKDFIGTSQGDKEHMLGKFLYFSLSNLLVEKEALSKLCEDIGISYTGSKRLSVADAFRSATGDIQERYLVAVKGKTHIYRAYCRDNEHTADILSRVLVRETALSAVRQPQADRDYLHQLPAQSGRHKVEHRGAHVLCSPDVHRQGGHF